MKKKLTLFLTLIMAIVSLFSVGAINAFAEGTEEPDFSVTVADCQVVKGSDLTIEYTLKHGDDIIKWFSETKEAENGLQFQVIKYPYVEVLDGEKNIAEVKDSVVTLKTSTFEKGEKTLTINVYSEKDGAPLATNTFKLTVNKKDNTTMFVMLGLIVLIIGYMIWSSRQNKKKQAQAQQMVSVLKVGDKVKTIGGVCGKVTEINDSENTFTLEVGSNSFVKFDKGAIYQTAPASAGAQEPAQQVVEEKPAEEKPKKTQKKKKDTDETL